MAVKQNPMTRNGKDAKTKITIYNMDTTSYFAHVKWTKQMVVHGFQQHLELDQNPK